jgi:hypothetical protein
MLDEGETESLGEGRKLFRRVWEGDVLIEKDIGRG